MIRLAIAATLAIAADDAPPPPATPAGPAVACISTINLRTRVHSDSVVDFTVNGRTYRNTLPGPCPGLGAERRFAYSLPTPRLCDVDIITVLQGPGPSGGASCGLGRFQPVTPTRPAR